MKVVILAGGVGNRLGGDTEVGPKPMVEIGGRPLLWHIMHHYSRYGFKEFLVATGYRGGVIKRYFANFWLEENDIQVDLETGQSTALNGENSMDWVVNIIDTGSRTETGGRLRRLATHLADGTFMLTFGDAVSDVDLGALLDVHRSAGALATITAVHPAPRFGELKLDGDQVSEFSEKPLDSGWINGGFMVMEPGVIGEIEGEDTPLVPSVIELLAVRDLLAAYRHDGFWHAVDSMRDKVLLESLWDSGTPPWMHGAGDRSQ